jgi:glucose/mannose transport system substrate-binding protein
MSAWAVRAVNAGKGQRLVQRALLWAALGAGLLSCSIGPRNETAAAMDRAPIEVFSWGGLQDDLVTLHERRHPQDDIIHANAQVSDVSRMVLRKRLASGDPPDTFQVNAGLDLMQWVRINQVDARESRLQPLDDLPGMSAAMAAWPPPLLAALSHDGHPYAVPANVHRINQLFFNPSVLHEAGLMPPEHTEDLFVLGEALARRGIPLLAIGSKAPWTLSVLILESLLIAQHGPDFYHDYFSGRLDPADARIEQTALSALRLLQYSNPDRESLHWEQAAEMVFEGRAAMTVMGDWARTLFDSSGGDVAARYREMSFPDTAGVFVFACNVFPLPIGARNEAGSRRLLELIASAEAQAAIARSTTSIPARLDIDMSSSDPDQRHKQHLWRSGRLVLAQSGLVPPSVSRDLNDALAVMDRERRASPLLHALGARYMLLGR